MQKRKTNSQQNIELIKQNAKLIKQNQEQIALMTEDVRIQSNYNISAANYRGISAAEFAIIIIQLWFLLKYVKKLANK